jgi:hypothetical protein
VFNFNDYGKLAAKGYAGVCILSIDSNCTKRKAVGISTDFGGFLFALTAFFIVNAVRQTQTPHAKAHAKRTSPKKQVATWAQICYHNIKGQNI